MMIAVAACLALVLAGIAALHAYWGFGGLWPAADERMLIRTVVGDPRLRRMPPPLLCWLVAGAIGLTAIWPVALVSRPALVPHALLVGVGFIMMAVFLLRGLAGFLPAWRRRHAVEPYATLDLRYYSPLCLVIAAGYLVLLTAGA